MLKLFFEVKSFRIHMPKLKSVPKKLKPVPKRFRQITKQVPKSTENCIICIIDVLYMYFPGLSCFFPELSCVRNDFCLNVKGFLGFSCFFQRPQHFGPKRLSFFWIFLICLTPAPILTKKSEAFLFFMRPQRFLV